MKIQFNFVRVKIGQIKFSLICKNGLEKGRGFMILIKDLIIYFELVYFVTALVPSLTACLANSPGSNKRTEV